MTAPSGGILICKRGAIRLGASRRCSTFVAFDKPSRGSGIDAAFSQRPGNHRVRPDNRMRGNLDPLGDRYLCPKPDIVADPDWC